MIHVILNIQSEPKISSPDHSRFTNSRSFPASLGNEKGENSGQYHRWKNQGES